jgi:hypothetical protein
MPRTHRTSDAFDLAGRMMQALAAAERRALEHVQHWRRTGMPLEEAAATMGIVAQIARTERSVLAAS